MPGLTRSTAPVDTLHVADGKYKDVLGELPYCD